jgi:hypothetical protein
MPQVRVEVPVEVHGLLRVEAARRGVTLARAIVALVGESLGVVGGEAQVVPSRATLSVTARAKVAQVPTSRVEGSGGGVEVGSQTAGPVRVVGRKVVESEWSAPVGLSKADQVKRGGRK